MNVLSYSFYSLPLKLSNKEMDFSFPLLKLPNKGNENYSKIILFISFSHSKVVFGWGENREDGKWREENRVENIVFHCLVGEDRKLGRKFSLLGPHFLSSQIGRKS